ncbi:hypothetical protein DPX16_2349 [Anabarilius grahami]|uniref:Uncharacterized protein n=1 Tax=Anabarilius grahami TaxID=495550 RepID=A0A3N0YH46_ANAGA|nr:hypothetical protein DPX16_2349 [Anabarilius grahami]
MGKRKDLSEFGKGQIVMGQSISKTAALVGCSRSAVVSIYQKCSEEGTVVNRRQGHGFIELMKVKLVLLEKCQNTHVQLDGVIYNNHTVYETAGVLLNSQSDVRTLVGIIQLGDVQERGPEPHDQENCIRLRFLQIKTQTNPPSLIQTSSSESASLDTGYFKSQNHQNNTNSSKRVIEREVFSVGTCEDRHAHRTARMKKTPRRSQV